MSAALLAELVYINVIQTLEGDEDLAEALAEQVVDAILRHRPYTVFEDSAHSTTVVKGWTIDGRFFPTRVVSSEHDRAFDDIRQELIDLLPCDPEIAMCVATAGLDTVMWDAGLPTSPTLDVPAHQNDQVFH